MAKVLVMWKDCARAVAPGSVLDQWRPEPRDQIKRGDWEEVEGREGRGALPFRPVSDRKGVWRARTDQIVSGAGSMAANFGRARGDYH